MKTTEAITEALVCIKKWNPSFQPKFFMTNCSNEEINSLDSVFPECSVFICNFHREQAWEQCLSKSINGCSTIKNDVKMLLQLIAHVKTIPNRKEAGFVSKREGCLPTDKIDYCLI
ncbi:uncharacterized protein LOC136076438 [Hydra vulgaris]|uniref:Uncharacterized protein LOC136076437 n=1 Tax=Hydra vulgaris TaxID=6087 RepID=A0ABM4BAF3_HYDVU